MTDSVAHTFTWENSERFERLNTILGTPLEGPLSGEGMVRALLEKFLTDHLTKVAEEVPPDPTIVLDLQGLCSITKYKMRPLSLIQHYVDHSLTVVQCRPVSSSPHGALLYIRHPGNLFDADRYRAAINSFNASQKPDEPVAVPVAVSPAAIARTHRHGGGQQPMMRPASMRH